MSPALARRRRGTGTARATGRSSASGRTTGNSLTASRRATESPIDESMCLRASLPGHGETGRGRPESGPGFAGGCARSRVPRGPSAVATSGSPHEICRPVSRHHPVVDLGRPIGVEDHLPRSRAPRGHCGQPGVLGWRDRCVRGLRQVLDAPTVAGRLKAHRRVRAPTPGGNHRGTTDPRARPTLTWPAIGTCRVISSYFPVSQDHG